MTLSIFHKGLLLVAVPLLLQATLAAMVSWQMERHNQARQRALHTKNVVGEAQEVLMLLVDAQTGMRGYLLTGAEEFTRPYDRAVQELEGSLSRLRTLVGDNERQHAAAATIAGQAVSFFNYVDDNIRTARGGNAERAIARVKTGEGTTLMTELRTAIQSFVTEEQRLDLERLEAEQAARQRMTWLLIGGVVVAALATVALGMVFYRGIVNRIAIVHDNVSRLEQAQELHCPLTGNDEAAHIDRAFQRLARALKEAAARERAQLAGLEERVAERTAAMTAANFQLQRNVNRFRSLVSATSQIVWTAGADGQPQDAQAWAQFTGLPHDQLRDEGWLAALHPDDREPSVQTWRAAQTSRRYECEYRLRRADGAWRHMRVQGVPIVDEGDNLLEWVGVCEDITERKSAEEALRQLNVDLEQRVLERTVQLEAANKELEAFSYSVSHDLRAPLRAMDGFARILVENYAAALPDKAKHYLRRVQENAQQMGRLVDDLLSFSRLGRQPLNKRHVAVADLVRLVVAELSSGLDDRHVEFAIGVLPDCEAEPALIRQAFINLIDNALKFTGPRPAARIEISSQKDVEPPYGTVYFVKDNGVGFDMRYANKLFGVFQRLHRAEEFKGTGVGLAIVQRVAQRHGGRVWAESELDHGAAFYFTLEGTSS